jgi:hypothetical protein
MIHSTSNSTPLPGAITHADAKPAARPSPAAPAPDSLDTTASTALREALASQPEIRPEEVERGRTLAVDANYPPRAIIENIARMFLNSQDPSNQA